MKLEEKLEAIKDHLVGIWLYRTPEHRQKDHPNGEWCATLLIDGDLVDTETYPKIVDTIDRAMEILDNEKCSS